ncbi:hypothetical protein [Ralstonia phage RSF1]|uniref:Uncharacterized protein n=1 Tax=Ralstonia phage RSF1 TaxID=1689679 RepID=A0A0K2QQT3_9CAUD|nr:hypothetical protein AVU11_gp150 [Ralstonia phage RSF1]BAS04942.1 hypothetical protein [Ralstonia phage RSF1]
MATKAGRAKFEDVKKGAKLYFVNGFNFSRDIVKLFVTSGYERSVETEDAAFPDTYEWFEAIEMDGRKKTSYVHSHHFSDVGIDTPFAKAEPATSSLYPEAKQAFFISEWHALQYIRRLDRLYNRRPAIASHHGSKRKTQLRTRQINLEHAKRASEEEWAAHDETFALAP